MPKQSYSIHNNSGRINWGKLREKHISGQGSKDFFKEFDQELQAIRVAVQFGEELMWKMFAKQLILNLLETVSVLLRVVHVIEAKLMEKK